MLFFQNQISANNLNDGLSQKTTAEQYEKTNQIFEGYSPHVIYTQLHQLSEKDKTPFPKIINLYYMAAFDQYDRKLYLQALISLMRALLIATATNCSGTKITCNTLKRKREEADVPIANKNYLFLFARTFLETALQYGLEFGYIKNYSEQTQEPIFFVIYTHFLNKKGLYNITLENLKNLERYPVISKEDQFQPLLNEGFALVKQENYTKAIACYEAATLLSPTDAPQLQTFIEELEEKQTTSSLKIAP